MAENITQLANTSTNNDDGWIELKQDNDVTPDERTEILANTGKNKIERLISKYGRS